MDVRDSKAAMGEQDQEKPTVSRWDSFAGFILAVNGTHWKKQFPLLNGKDGRPAIDRALVAKLFVDYRKEASEEDILVYFAKRLKALSGETIKPIPPMSDEEYLAAILKQEQRILESLGLEQGRALLEGLANEWGYWDYEKNKMNPKTRPDIARAIKAI